MSVSHHAHAMRFGASVRPQGGVDFRLWAPGANRVELVLMLKVGDGEEARFVEAHGDAGRREEAPTPSGWYELFVPESTPGTRYRWRIDGQLDVPDPASRSNPAGVHDFSEVIDPLSFEWTQSAGWAGRPWAEAVMYEMHVGAFTPEGTYAAAQPRLAALADLGITAIQLMPQASYPGRFGWGYDGVLPFAPQCSHCSPGDLKRFIDAAHGLGLIGLPGLVLQPPRARWVRWSGLHSPPRPWVGWVWRFPRSRPIARRVSTREIAPAPASSDARENDDGSVTFGVSFGMMGSDVTLRTALTTS